MEVKSDWSVLMELKSDWFILTEVKSLWSSLGLLQADGVHGSSTKTSDSL